MTPVSRDLSLSEKPEPDLFIFFGISSKTSNRLSKRMSDRNKKNIWIIWPPINFILWPCLWPCLWPSVWPCVSAGHTVLCLDHLTCRSETVLQQFNQQRSHHLTANHCDYKGDFPALSCKASLNMSAVCFTVHGSETSWGFFEPPV